MSVPLSPKGLGLELTFQFGPSRTPLSREALGKETLLGAVTGRLLTPQTLLSIIAATAAPTYPAKQRKDSPLLTGGFEAREAQKEGSPQLIWSQC